MTALKTPRLRLHSRRRTLVAAIVAFPGLVLMGARAVPWDIGTPWIQLLAAAPYVTVLLVAAAALSFPARGKTAVVVSCVLCAALLVQLFWVVPRFFGQPSEGIDNAPMQGAASVGPAAGSFLADGSAHPRQLRVMSLNIGGGNPDLTRIVQLASDSNVDVLALLELNPATAKALNKAGLRSLFPYKLVKVQWGGTGGGIYAKYPLTDLGLVPGTAFYQPRASLTVPWSNTPVWLTAVHADSPRPGHTSSWRSDLRALTKPRHPGEPVLLLGDFNASIDHRELRALLADGYTDAASATGRSLWPTWPENSPLPPFVAIDHVLSDSSVLVQDYWTEAVGGTDHAAVLATLAMPR